MELGRLRDDANGGKGRVPNFEKADRRTDPSDTVDKGQQTLAFLREHRLDPTPANYELAYRYRSERNSLIARAVDAIVMSGDRLKQAQADSIVQTHVRPPSQVDLEHHRAMRMQALALAEIAADATATTGQFGRELTAGLGDLGKGADVAGIVAAMAEQAMSTEKALADAARQIAALREEVEAAKGDAARDALTGLHNRRGVENQVKTMAVAKQSSLVICDIDRFKSVNDRYGHVVGDRVLKLVATSLAASCEPHLVARWGGEEFIILMNGIDVKTAAAVIDGARRDLAARDVKLRTTDEPLGAITFSAGVSPLDGRRFDDAVRDADALLYRAKNEGRDRVVF